MAAKWTSTAAVDLYFLLQDFSIKQLRRLRLEDVSWLPYSLGMLPEEVYPAIIKAVETADCDECRLRRIAYLRSWLLPLQRMVELRLHRLTTTPLWEECLALLGRIAAALRFEEREATLGWTMHRTTLAACVLTGIPGSPPEQSPLYVILWPLRPLLGIYCANTAIQEQAAVALRAALGYDPHELGSVRPENIDEFSRFDDRVLLQFLDRPEDDLRFYCEYVEGAASAASSENDSPSCCRKCDRYFISRKPRDWHEWHEHHN